MYIPGPREILEIRVGGSVMLGELLGLILATPVQVRVLPFDAVQALPPPALESAAAWKCRRGGPDAELDADCVPAAPGAVQFWIGWVFHRGAWRALRRGRANMDVLISVGSTAAYIYSIISLVFGSIHHGEHVWMGVWGGCGDESVGLGR